MSLQTRKASAKLNAVKPAAISTGVSKCPAKGAKAVEALLTKAGYRRDMVKFAQAKYAACLKSLKKPKSTTMTKRRAAKTVAAAPEEEVN